MPFDHTHFHSYILLPASEPVMLIYSLNTTSNFLVRIISVHLIIVLMLSRWQVHWSWSQPNLQTVRIKVPIRNLRKLMGLQYLPAVVTVKKHHPRISMLFFCSWNHVFLSSSGKLKLWSSDGQFSGDYSGEGSSDVNDLKVPIWMCGYTCIVFSVWTILI